MSRLDWLNDLEPAAAEAEFLTCCGSRRWAEAMTRARPFLDTSRLLDTADSAWAGLDAADWLEAFRAHPRLGEQSSAMWSREEQSGIRDSPARQLASLAARNQEYERRFGHICIVCATGRSTADVLKTIEERLSHDAATELRVAAGEQAKITRLRLQKLLAQGDDVDPREGTRNA